MYRKLSPSSHRGFTALELIIVLVIGFSIIAMSASKMGELFNNSKITRAVDNIMQLNTSLSSLQGINGLGDITVEMAIKNDLVPKTLKRSTDGKTLTNEWDGLVNFDIANGTFSLSYADVPKKSCTKLASALINSGALNSLQINGQPIDANASAANIMKACAEEDSAILKIFFNNDTQPAPVPAGNP